MNARAYAACAEVVRQHYENFPVASRLLPASFRPHVAAVYAFARTADDFADEGRRSPDERLALIDDWRARLHAAAGGRSADDSQASLIFAALAETMSTCSLPLELFDDLLSAFRQDVTVTRYDTWSDVCDYCRRSANPVGRLVLRIAGYREPRIDAWSDAVCTALQVANFLQDLERDWAKGRLYIPLEFTNATGADLEDLDRRELTPPWQAALAMVCARARASFERGRAVADAVRGRLRWEIRATWLGGMRVLERLEANRFDVFRNRPTLGWRDAPPLAWRLLSW